MLDDRPTRLAFALLGLYSYVINGLGPTLPALRDDLGLGRTVVGLHSTAFAAGLLVAGLVGARLVRSLGRRGLTLLALGGLATGMVLLATGNVLAVTLTGAAVGGSTGALLLVVVPAVLSERHPARRAQAIAAANALAGVAAVSSQLVAAAADAAGLGARASLLVVPIVAPALALWLRRTSLEPSTVDTETAAAGRLPAAYWRAWVGVLLAVSVEFCFVFWGVDYLHTVGGLSSAVAAAAAGLFLLGMTLGRAAGGRRLPDHPGLYPAALAVAAAGFVALWTGGHPAVGPAGLFVAGLGVALLYPLTLGAALAAGRDRPDAASARASIASGLAATTAPFVLGAAADRLGLHTAFLVVPVLLGAAALAHLAAGQPSGQLR